MRSSEQIESSGQPAGGLAADPELIDRIAATTGLSATEAARVVDDVVAYFSEPLDGFVRRRHAALQARGHKNPDIFATIGCELGSRVVAAPQLTARQMRRLVYG